MTTPQRVMVAVKATRDCHETTGALGHGTRLSPPGRRTTRRGRRNPNLENSCRRLLQVVFGMPDASAGAHDLNVSRFDSAFVAETISVSDCTFTDIGDDLNIGMRLQRKARVRHDLFVVPNTHAAPATSRWIILRGGGKVTPGF